MGLNKQKSIILGIAAFFYILSNFHMLKNGHLTLSVKRDDRQSFYVIRMSLNVKLSLSRETIGSWKMRLNKGKGTANKNKLIFAVTLTNDSIKKD